MAEVTESQQAIVRVTPADGMQPFTMQSKEDRKKGRKEGRKKKQEPETKESSARRSGLCHGEVSTPGCLWCLLLLLLLLLGLGLSLSKPFPVFFLCLESFRSTFASLLVDRALSTRRRGAVFLRVI